MRRMKDMSLIKSYAESTLGSQVLDVLDEVADPGLLLQHLSAVRSPLRVVFARLDASTASAVPEPGTGLLTELTGSRPASPEA